MKRLILFLTFLCGGIFVPASLCAVSESKSEDTIEDVFANLLWEQREINHGCVFVASDHEFEIYGKDFSRYKAQGLFKNNDASHAVVCYRRIGDEIYTTILTSGLSYKLETCFVNGLKTARQTSFNPISREECKRLGLPSRFAPCSDQGPSPMLLTFKSTMPSPSETFKTLAAKYKEEAVAQSLGKDLSDFVGEICSESDKQFVVYNRQKSSNSSEEVFHWFLCKNDACYVYNSENAEWRIVELKQDISCGGWNFQLSPKVLSDQEKKDRNLPVVRFDSKTTMMGAGVAAKKKVSVKKIELDPVTGAVRSKISFKTGDFSDDEKKPYAPRLVASDSKNPENSIFAPQSFFAALVAACCIGALEYSQMKNDSFWLQSAQALRLNRLKELIQKKLPERIKNSVVAQKALACSVACLATWGVKKISGLQVLQSCKDDINFVPSIPNISILALNGYAFYAFARYLLTPAPCKEALYAFHGTDVHVEPSAVVAA